MRSAGIALLLATALLAGCGGGGKSSAKSNGEASKSATQVLADARAAATSASSMHVSGNVNTGGTAISLDLSLAAGKGATGKMTTSGLEFDLIRIGDTVYIRGSDAFLKHYAGAAAQLLHGKWLKGSATKGQLGSLAALTSPAALFNGISSHHGKLANDGLKTYKGQQVVEIRDTSDNSKLYVAATGTAYPVAIVGPKSSAGSITFDKWNASVTLSAPKGAIDISKFGGG